MTSLPANHNAGDLGALRARMRVTRAELAPAQRMSAAQRLRRNLEQLPAWRVAEHVAGYWACGGELPLNLALASLVADKQAFYLPRVGPDRQLAFAHWQTGDPVTPNRFGIPEPGADAPLCAPQALDLVLLPLLAFNRDGVRLGMGGGYYDTTFGFLLGQTRPTRPLLVGVGYAFQEHPALTARAWDVPLDYVATDEALIACHHHNENA